jgi:hypothetical protein
MMSTLVPRESVESKVGFPGTVRAGSEAGPGDGGGGSADAGDAVGSINAHNTIAAEARRRISCIEVPFGG